MVGVGNARREGKGPGEHQAGEKSARETLHTGKSFLSWTLGV
jgi:hypothetical protein